MTIASLTGIFAPEVSFKIHKHKKFIAVCIYGSSNESQANPDVVAILDC